MVRHTSKRDDSKGKDGEGNVRAQRNQYRNGGQGPNGPSKPPGQTGPDTDPKTSRGGMRDGGAAKPQKVWEKVGNAKGHSFEGRDAQFNPNAKLDTSRVSKRVNVPDDGLPHPKAQNSPIAPARGSAMKRDPKRGGNRPAVGDMKARSDSSPSQMKNKSKLEALLRAARKTK